MSKELFPMIRRTEENVEFRIRVRGWGTDRARGLQTGGSCLTAA